MNDEKICPFNHGDGFVPCYEKRCMAYKEDRDPPCRLIEKDE